MCLYVWKYVLQHSYSAYQWHELMWTRKGQLMQDLLQQQCVYEGSGSRGRNLSSAGNSTLEQNITSIGKPVVKLWPFLYIQDGRQPPSWIFENQKLHQ